MPERIQKIISASGIMSRRKAEDLIRKGRVAVNGMLAHIGDCAAPDDVITIDGKEISRSASLYYIALNKPRGYLTTMSDEKGRKTVIDLVRDLPARIYPVGRLDMYSEGLLIMTNDGEFAYKLSHPSYEHEKVYHVSVCGEAVEQSLDRLSKPFMIDNIRVCAVQVVLLEKKDKDALISIVISEGRNRQVRRMCEESGLKVKRLQRIQEGPVSLGNLPSGSWRYLSQNEIDLVLER